MATHQKSNLNQAQKTAHKRRTVNPIQQETALGLMRQPDLAVLQRAVADPGRAVQADILALQRAYGNRAVTRLIQTKLTVGPVGDRYEREADRVAERVMGMLTPARERGGRGEGERALRRQVGEEEELQMQPLAASITPIVQRQLDEEDEIQMQPLVQRQVGGERGFQDINGSDIVQRQLDEEDEIQMKPLVQRQLDEEDEMQMQPLVQRQVGGERGFQDINGSDIVQRQLDEEDEIQMKPLVQRQLDEEDEMQMQPLVQRQVGGERGFQDINGSDIVQRQLDEEDEIQMKPLVQRQLDEEDEMQMQPLVQRQLDEEDEMQMQPLVQRQLDEEDEMQMQPLVQRQLDEEDEMQMQPLVQRQLDEEDEIQMKPLIQRQLNEEEELQMQPLVQRQLDEEDEIQMQPLAQRQLDDEDEIQMQPLVQRRADGGFEAGSSLERRLTAHKGGGSPLPDETRTFMEPRFGADFSDVRVHTGNEATGMNKELRSRAFTHGRDIYFGSGKYDSGTGAGKRLLAHELTHVIQQSGKNDRIARWGGPSDKHGETTGHDEVTADAFDKIRNPKTGKTGFSQGAQEYLKSRSEQMDLRAGFLVMVGIAGKIYQPLMSRMAKDPKAYDNMQGYWRAASEAPNHAEGGLYRSDSGAGVDKERVDLNLEKAIVAWDKNNPSQSLTMLGLAIHTAEDRGAHGDGAPGTGHDPRRVVKPPEGATTGHYYEGPDWIGSDCDRKSKNPGGYAFSVVKAADVLTRFRTAVKNENKLEKYKRPGKLARIWRGGKIFVGSGHTNLKWDRDWKGKKGLAKKTGAVVGAIPALALKYGYQGGKGGLKMGHRTSRQIWKGRVGGKGGLAGRIKRGWGGFGRGVRGAFGGYTERMGERFGRARENYEEEMRKAERAGGGHTRRWKKLLAKTKYGAKLAGRTIQGGLGYARRGLTTGVGAVLGAGATALGAGLGTAGSLAAYGVGGGVGLGGGLAGGALRGAFEYTGRPLWALGKPFQALGRKMRGREAGKGYEGRSILETATAIGCRVDQTLELMKIDQDSWDALAQAMERLDKKQRKAFTKLAPDKLKLLGRLSPEDLKGLDKLAPEQIFQIGPKTIAHVPGWLKTLKEEDAPFESALAFGFSLPQLTALGKFKPDQMKALSAGLEALDKNQRNAFTSLEPNQLKMLAQFNTNQITALFEGIKDLDKYQFNAFVEFDRLKSLARFSPNSLTALFEGMQDFYPYQIGAFVDLETDRFEALAQFSSNKLTALLKVIKGLNTGQITVFMDLEAEEIAGMSKKRIETIKRELMV